MLTTLICRHCDPPRIGRSNISIAYRKYNRLAITWVANLIKYPCWYTKISQAWKVPKISLIKPWKFLCIMANKQADFKLVYLLGLALSPEPVGWACILIYLTVVVYFLLQEMLFPHIEQIQGHLFALVTQQHLRFPNLYTKRGFLNSISAEKTEK